MVLFGRAFIGTRTFVQSFYIFCCFVYIDLFFLSRKRRELLKLKSFILHFLLLVLFIYRLLFGIFKMILPFYEFAKMHLEKKGGWKVFIDLWAAQLILYSPLLFPLMLYLPIKYFIQYWQTDIIAKDGSKKIFKGKMIWGKIIIF